ncbi:MAG: hypothetical protein NTZ73_03705 [Candidatus Diapherotrites archaeon]|nr:hypothetical protein [Candidatus Diapherotrites archaeon]
MQTHSKLSAQGTIEYVVLLAIIVVIGLVVVVLASDFVDSTPGINKGRADLFWSSQGLAIVDAGADSNGDAIFKFKNSGLEEVTVTGINVDGVDLNVDSAKISGGDDQTVTVSNLSGCVGGSRTYSVKITYKNKYGVQNTVGPSEFVMSCTPDVPVQVYVPGDTTPPSVALVSPLSGTVDEDGFVTFTYTASDNVAVSNCNLIIGTSFDQSGNSGSFDKNFVPIGEGVYSWDVNCVDGNSNWAGSNNGGPWDVNFSILQDGSYAHPFLLSSCVELQNMSLDLDANYALAQDIDCSDTVNWNMDEDEESETFEQYLGFAPIGKAGYCENPNPNCDNSWSCEYDCESTWVVTPPYSGTFDGRNYSINDLYIYRPSTTYVGLFGRIDHSEVKDLGMENSSITGYYHIGGIVGKADYSSVVNSYNTGTVTAAGGGEESCAGGITGWNYSSSVVNSYNTGTVSGYAWVGGMAGSNEYLSVVEGSYNAGNITSLGPEDDSVGGIVGFNSDSLVVNSYNTGTITGGVRTGGIAGLNMVGWDGFGYNGPSYIVNSYNTGTINAGGCCGYTGGIVGTNGDSVVKNSFSVSTINGGGVYSEGVVGNNDPASVLNLYWLDSNLSDSATACYHSGDANCTHAVEASDFYSSGYGVYTGSPAWDDGNWVWLGEYPTLSWQ